MSMRKGEGKMDRSGSGGTTSWQWCGRLGLNADDGVVAQGAQIAFNTQDGLVACMAWTDRHAGQPQHLHEAGQLLTFLGMEWDN